MEDGLYRVVPKEGTSYVFLEVYSDTVDDSLSVLTDTPVQRYLEKGYTFTRVYPIHLPDEMWKEVQNEALAANISDDDVVETAIRKFFDFYNRIKE